MITELQKKKHDYQMLSIKSNIVFGYNDIARKFDYEPHFLKKGEDFTMKTWDIELVMELINDIINYSNYSLISVSEDSDYLRYHFVS